MTLANAGLYLALFPGDGKKSRRFLFDMLATALGAFHVDFMFFEGENQFEGLVAVEANIIVHGHGILPLDRDHELRLKLYALGRSLCDPSAQDQVRIFGMSFQVARYKRTDHIHF